MLTLGTVHKQYQDKKNVQLQPQNNPKLLLLLYYHEEDQICILAQK